MTTLSLPLASLISGGRSGTSANIIGTFIISVICAILFASKCDADTHHRGWLTERPLNLSSALFSPRHAIFYQGDPISFKVSGSANHYEIRNYFGSVVAQGAVGPNNDIKPPEPGWYRLYLRNPGATDLIGATTFVVWRKNPNFPVLPPVPLRNGSYIAMDAPGRGLIGLGPDRLFVEDANKPDQAIIRLNEDIALNKYFYLPFDPIRKRVLMTNFPNGTTGKLDGVRSIVSAVGSDIKYFEGRNEPNQHSTGSAFATNELKPFYNAIKSVDPSLKVMGPGTVTITPTMLPWLEDFFKAGGGKTIDVFSFHAYNVINGDVCSGRKALNNLNSLLAKYGLTNIEKWQTEQGYGAPVWGVYEPKHQGRWTMLQMMLFEQYGIPKEHNVYWYDRSHGYWEAPMFWENDDGSLNPAAALMRVWSEELYGTKFKSAYNLGEGGNKLCLGSLFVGPSKQVATFMNTGAGIIRVRVKVTGTDKLHVVSPFGVEGSIPVTDGQATLSIGDLPTYIELNTNQALQVVPTDWGENIARSPRATVSVSQNEWLPIFAPKDDLSKLNNGILECGYWLDQPWSMNKVRFPVVLQVNFNRPETISRVVLYAHPPWQLMGSLLEYKLEYAKDGKWLRLDSVKEPTDSFPCTSWLTRTSYDSFFSGRWIFCHTFSPVKTDKIRFVITDSTLGGEPTSEVAAAGGQAADSKNLTLREIEVYGR